jgi:hypothetical protein
VCLVILKQSTQFAAAFSVSGLPCFEPFKKNLKSKPGAKNMASIQIRKVNVVIANQRQASSSARVSTLKRQGVRPGNGRTSVMKAVGVEPQRLSISMFVDAFSMD